MRFIKLLITTIFIANIIFANLSFASKTTEVINGLNIPKMSQDVLGFQYDSHGCFHFYPTDIYLLYKLVPSYSTLKIYEYGKKPPKKFKKVPWAVDVITNKKELSRYRKKLKNSKHTKVYAYPTSRLWVITYKNKPIFKIKALPGPDKPYLLAFNSLEMKNISFEPSLSHQTTPGTYYFLGRTIDFYTPYYKDTTIMPMGAQIKKTKYGYVYYKKGKAYPVPKSVKTDLNTKSLRFSYFNIRENSRGEIVEAFWGNHDFGKYAIFWSKDKKTVCNEMGYATGEILYEQVNFLHDLAYAISQLTIDNSFGHFLESFPDYQNYKTALKILNGKSNAYLSNKTVTTYLKMMYRKEVTPDQWQDVPPHIRAAYKKFYFDDKYKLSNREIKALKKIKLNIYDKHKIFGLERDLYQYKIALDKKILKFSYLKKHWPQFQKLAGLLKTEFDKNPGLSLKEKKQHIFNLINKRFILETITDKDLQIKIQKSQYNKLLPGYIEL